MAERLQSHDGHRDTDDILGAKGAIGQSGREVGCLTRDIGTKDEFKREGERPAGATRAKKTDAQDGES